MTTKKSKTKLNWKITSKVEINKTLIPRVTRKKQSHSQSSSCHFSSRNKIKVT